MNEIKNVIGLLCKHLNTLIGINLKSEYFRLGKFNKNEDNVIPIFWHVLNILTINADIDIVENVKIYFKTLNYRNSEFYLLSNDMKAGSRELLIALCYILCNRLNALILEEFKKSCFHPKFNILCQYFNGLKARTDYSYMINFKNDLNWDNYVKWIKGKIELNEKMIREYDIQNDKLFRKLKCETTLEDLSLNEILALNSEKYSKVLLEKSERIVQILQNHTNWKKRELIFWKWMDTVLLERNKEIKKIKY